MRRTAAVVACLALAGCAPKAFIHPNPEAVNRGADMAQCEYEIEMGARGVSVPWWYNNRQAAGYLVGAAIGSAIRADRLRTLCMQAKGYIPVPLDGSAAPIGGPQPYLPGVVPAAAYNAPPPPPSGLPPGTPPGAIAGTPMMQPVPALPAGAAPRVAAGIKGESRFQYQAEGVAKAENCTPPSTAMTSKGAGMEMFAIACPNGTTLAIRCEVDGCRVLR